MDTTNPERFVPYWANETSKCVQELVGNSDKMKFLPNCRSYFLMNFFIIVVGKWKLCIMNRAIKAFKNMHNMHFWLLDTFQWGWKVYPRLVVFTAHSLIKHLQRSVIWTAGGGGATQHSLINTLGWTPFATWEWKSQRLTIWQQERGSRVDCSCTFG